MEIHGESKRTGPSGNKIVKIDVISFLPNEYQVLKTGYQALFCENRMAIALFKFKMLISLKTSKNVAAHGRA